jgi:hypothetical protein
MVNQHMGRMAIVAAAMIGLAGCTILPPQGVTVAPANTTFGSLVPVYNPPPNAPLRCVAVGDLVTSFRVPGDLKTPLPTTSSPFATMGNRRGVWLLIVTRAGVIGWTYDPHERSFSPEYPGMWCHVYQDAQGRIVFNHYHLVHGTF